MYPHEPLRVCTNCRVHHYDNCPDCFGWGLHRSATSGELVPVLAVHAHGDVPPPTYLEPCRRCGSTIKGPSTFEERVRQMLDVFPHDENCIVSSGEPCDCTWWERLTAAVARAIRAADTEASIDSHDGLHRPTTEAVLEELRSVPAGDRTQDL